MFALSFLIILFKGKFNIFRSHLFHVSISSPSHRRTTQWGKGATSLPNLCKIVGTFRQQGGTTLDRESKQTFSPGLKKMCMSLYIWVCTFNCNQLYYDRSQTTVEFKVNSRKFKRACTRCIYMQDQPESTTVRFSLVQLTNPLNITCSSRNMLGHTGIKQRVYITEPHNKIKRWQSISTFIIQNVTSSQCIFHAFQDKRYKASPPQQCTSNCNGAG